MSPGLSVRRIAVSVGVTLLVVASVVALVSPASAATVDATTVGPTVHPQTSNGTATNGTATGNGTTIDNGTANDTAPEPEFELTVTTNTDRVVVGDPYVVNVTVRNVGNETGTKSVEFDAEGRVVADRDVTLAPGTNRTIRFTYRFSEAGNETVTVDYLIQRTVVVEPRRPEFRVGNVTVEDATVRPSEPIRISATVTNVGPANGTERVELVVFGEVVDVKAVTVASGETERVEFTQRINQPGTYTASIAGHERRIEVRAPDDPSPTPTQNPTPATGSAPGFGPLVTALVVIVTLSTVATVTWRHSR